MEPETINLKIKMLDNSINEIDVKSEAHVTEIKQEIEKVSPS